MTDRMYIRPMTNDERRRAEDRTKANNLLKCVSCGGPSRAEFCKFCLEEE